MKIKLLMRRALLLALLVTLASQITGCMGLRQDITNNPKYKTDYAKDQIYKIQKPLFVKKEISVEAFMPDTLFLERPGQSSDIPKNVEEYTNANKKKWPTVLGLIEPQTKIKIVKFQRELAFDDGWNFYIQAKVLDGIFADQTVDVSLISNLNGKKDDWLPIVNYEFLELEK